MSIYHVAYRLDFLMVTVSASAYGVARNAVIYG
jgi:hypothetical protein